MPTRRLDCRSVEVTSQSRSLYGRRVGVDVARMRRGEPGAEVAHEVPVARVVLGRVGPPRTGRRRPGTRCVHSSRATASPRQDRSQLCRTESPGTSAWDGCLNGRMTPAQEQPRVVSASREIAAGAGRIFELIADPAQQPRWDGNDNLATAPGGQRVRRAGEVFTMTLTYDGAIRENHVVEFEEGRRIAWRPAESGKRPPGHLWRWELEPGRAVRPGSAGSPGPGSPGPSARSAR